MKAKRTSITVPVLTDPGLRFRVMCSETGEILECSDLGPLLRYVAKNAEHLEVNRPDFPQRKAKVQLTYKIEVIS